MIDDDRVTGIRGLAASPNCAGCPCVRNGQPYKPVRAYGSPGGLCIVGEGPGNEEQLQGYPFIGPSGKVVNKGLKLAGVDRGYIWITNALLCKRPNDDEAAAIAVEHCRPRLQADLRNGCPTAICALGGTAMRALQLPVHFVAQARGTVQYSPLVPNVPVIGSIHPAALLRGGAGEMAGSGGKQKMNVDAQAMFLFSDIEKTARVADGSLPPNWSDDILVIHEAAEVEAAMDAILKDIYEWGILGLDLEWICDGSKNALDALGAGADRAIITWVGVGCGTRAVSFKWEALLENYNERGVELPNGVGALDSALSILQTAMLDESLPKLCWNKQADIAVWEAQVGSIRGRRLDGMLMHHGAYPGIDHDLQQGTSQCLCVPPWKVDHARAVQEHKAEEREQAKAVKATEREKKKAEKMAAHEARNAQLHADKLARKAAKQPKKKKTDGLGLEVDSRQLILGGVK
jgi:uracil-DNA glycosylase